MVHLVGRAAKREEAGRLFCRKQQYSGIGVCAVRKGSKRSLLRTSNKDRNFRSCSPHTEGGRASGAGGELFTYL